MLFKCLALAAAASLAAAQSNVLSFSRVPNPVTDGQANAITYITNDTVTPVTIVLRKGPSKNLQTIMTLTESATGGQYVWTPATSLPDGIDYALEIKQNNQINYFGPFVVQGYSGPASSSSSASSESSAASSSSSSMITSSASSGGVAGAGVGAGSSTTSSGMMMGTGGTSVGTGIPMSRNTTMSMATLSAPSTSSYASTTGASGASTIATSSPTGNAAADAYTNHAGGALAAAIGLAAAFL